MQKEWKQELQKKRLVHFWLWLQKRIDEKEIGLVREQILLDSLKKAMQSWRNTHLLYKEWDQGCICWTYNTIPEKKLCRYMEDNGYKYIHKLTQFVRALNFKRNCSIDLVPMNEKNSDFFVHSVQQTTTRN